MLLGFLLLVGFVLLSRQEYQSPADAELNKRVRYLERVIREGAGAGTDLAGINSQNPEWALFSLSFTAYALASRAQQQPALRPEAARYVAQAVAQALQPPIRSAFEPMAATASPIDTTGSVLYLGHLNLMLGCLRQLDPATRYSGLHDTLSGALYRRYGRALGGCLESYAGQRWVPDNTVALASLALHSQLTGSPYHRAARRWVARARQHYLDPKTGVLASQVDAQGQPQEEARGSMVGWSIWFLARFDPEFARQQYQRYQQHFSTNLGVLRLYRERAGAYTTSAGDLDSGPLLLGYSMPANAFAFADAVALHDQRNAQRLHRLIALGRRSVESPTELRYAVRFLDLPVSPLAEALLLYAECPVVR
ncbi:hypothetical protein [Hymenobacter canadensis]|uniref:Uncharacterized protein n=1 Tax=Hymenobacter canadensis TaxID=2999067 RepID=A0ABY7LSV4_9BACT|nr:hypothetical protein [Hymenobacter canadensis]WBA43488.1 hypothetical protein O3303_07940 [Hymenobacter canadensis]